MLNQSLHLPVRDCQKSAQCADVFGGVRRPKRITSNYNIPIIILCGNKERRLDSSVRGCRVLVSVAVIFALATRFGGAWKSGVEGHG